MFLIKFILITCSITWVLCLSRMVKPVREFISKKKIESKYIVDKMICGFFEAMLICYACTGFWASIAAYYLLERTLRFETIAYMFIGSFSSLVILTFHMKYLERK